MWLIVFIVTVLSHFPKIVCGESISPISVRNDYYEGTVNNRALFPLLFTFKEIAYQDVRVTVQIKEPAHEDDEVSFLVRQKTASFSWDLPRKSIYDGTKYLRASRTLCKEIDSYGETILGNASHKNSSVLIIVSTLSESPIEFSVTINISKTLLVVVGDRQNISVKPFAPELVIPRFRSDTILLHVKSPDRFCITASIQDATCPTFDQEENVILKGFWQTMNRQSGFLIQRKHFPNGVRVVFVLHGNDAICNQTDYVTKSRDVILTGDYLNISNKPSDRERLKRLSVEVQSVLSTTEIYLAVIGPLLLFLGIACTVVTLFVSEILSKYGDNRDTELSNFQTSAIGQLPETSTEITASLEATEATTADELRTNESFLTSESSKFLSDNCTTSPTALSSKSNRYLTAIISCSIFYIIPVFQMVLDHQERLIETGNMDFCYYNFLCSHPLWKFSDFNHVYSNVGYLILGITFLVIVYLRQRKHKQLKKIRPDMRSGKGIPSHFGFYYAMGAALAMEGVLSACYHICPNQSSFQFDTLFMYVNAVLCTLKLYHGRHPDKTVEAYVLFISLPLVAVLVPIFNSVGNEFSFYAVATSVHFVIYMILLYYFQIWKRPPLIVRAREDPSRLTILVMSTIVNFGMAIRGLILRPDDFATHVLAICVANFSVYFLFYVIMKILHEQICWNAIVSFVIGMTFLAISAVFFLHIQTSWEGTPAQSKNFNEKCIFFEYYDTHDIWHFLSSIAIFFFFLGLLTLDDDRAEIEWSNILVF